MKFVEELVVEEFLPTFRSMLAEALRERGLTQSEVAALLGISQSAVSKYVHGEVGRNEQLREDRRLQDLVDRLAEGLASGEMSRVQALVEAEVFVRQLEEGDLLAQLHEEAMPGLAEYGDDRFAVHDPDSPARESEAVLASVRRGVRILENARGFADLVPAVGSNLVESVADPLGVDDVAGVPGRIFDVEGSVEVPGGPEFGVSGHVATVLLAARSSGVDARAAVNVRYDPAIVAALEERGFPSVEFDADADVAPAIEAGLSAADDLATVGSEATGGDGGGDGRGGRDGDGRRGNRSDADAGDHDGNGNDAGEDDDAGDGVVLYQTGGMGIEPIVYVLAADAPTAARAVRDLP